MSTCPKCGNEDRNLVWREPEGDGWGPARERQCRKCHHASLTVEWMTLLAERGNLAAKCVLENAIEALWP